MENFMDFFKNNYIWMIGVFLFLLFTLIGFIADMNRKEKTEQLQKKADAMNKKQERVKKSVGIADAINHDMGVNKSIDNAISTNPQSSVNPVETVSGSEIKDEFVSPTITETTPIKDEFEMPITNDNDDIKKEEKAETQIVEEKK